MLIHNRRMEGRAQGKENGLMEKMIKKCEDVKKWAPGILKQKVANIPSPVTTPQLLPEVVLKSCGAMEAEPSIEVKQMQEFLRINVGRDAQSQTEYYPVLDAFAKLHEMDARKECRPRLPQQLLPNITELMPLVMLPIPQPVQTPLIQIIQGPTLHKCDTCQLFFTSKVQILEHLVVEGLARSRIFRLRMEASSTDNPGSNTPSTGALLKTKLEKQDDIPVEKKEHLPAKTESEVVPGPLMAAFIDNPSSVTPSSCALPKSEVLDKPDMQMKSRQQILNEQERIRRLNQNSNLKFLQESLPALEGRALERVPQLEVLVAAIWFIKHLKEEEADLCNEEKELRNHRDILLRKREELMSSLPEIQLIQDGLHQPQPNQDHSSSNCEVFGEKEPEVKACSSEQSRESPTVESVIGIKTMSQACSPDIIQAFSRRTFIDEQQNHDEEGGDGKPDDDEPAPKKLKRSSSPVVLHNHINHIPGSDPPLFQCNICKKKFKTKGFIQHESCQIKGDRPFKCEICGKGFSTKSRCEYHSRIHTGVQPFACTYCDKRFTDKSNLKRHLGIHTKEPSFTCSHCDMTFLSQSLLDSHLLTHSGPKTYACNHCTRTFASDKAIRRHLVIHSDENLEGPFQCPICQASFGRKFNRDRHIKITHEDAH